jgi:carbon-monoxide dehydrogenase medium subunit
MTSYAFPETVPEALALLEAGQGKARIIAGGTDLMPAIHDGKISPETIIDITRIKELGQITVLPDAVKIGAAVSFSTIKNHPFLKSFVSVLVQASSSIGAGGIQQTATLAGNIIQAMPAADGSIAALALEAEVLLCSKQGERWVPVSDLFIGPGKSAVNPCVEMIKSICFPLPEINREWGTAWARIGRRSALILPILNCAVKLVFEKTTDPQIISHAVIAVGPAGSVPQKADRAAAYLVGKQPIRENFFRTGDLAIKETIPRSSPLRASKEYRLEIIPKLISKTLIEATDQKHAVPEIQARGANQ